MRGRLEYAACFIVGFAVLALELLALRILAPRFGASSYVTGIVINVILVALALGYALGGRLADTHKSTAPAYLVILMCAVYLAGVFVSYTWLLAAVPPSSVKAGATVMVLLLFFVPTLLLAIVPPYFTGVMAPEHAVGRTAGRIYALSTLGSVCGGLFATFLSIPAFGSRNTFRIVIALLLGIAVAGLMKRTLKAFAGLLVLLCLASPAGYADGRVLYRGESEYNIITIVRADDRLYLKLNDSFGYHSESLDAATMLTGDYYDYFLLAPAVTDAKDTLILGNGAGTSMRQIGHFFRTRIDGVEIDPKLTELGRAYFGLKPSRKMRIFHEDARTFLNRNRRTYDVIVIDVYAGGPYVPFHVSTVEFYREVRRSLAPGGVVAVNVPFYALGTELADYFLSTIAVVFPEGTYRSGCVAYGFAAPVDAGVLRARLDRDALTPALKSLGQAIVARLDKVQASTRVLSDDHAPIETLTARLLDTPRTNYPDCTVPPLAVTAGER